MQTFDNEDRVFDLDMIVEHPDQDMAMPVVYPMDEPPVTELGATPQDEAISGTALRRRLITPEAIAEIAAEKPSPSLLQRLFGRKQGG